jgi:hypothetical protein
MEKVNTIHNELHIAILLYLWFEEDEISTKDLKKFLMKWEDKLSFKTVVRQGSEIKHDAFVFFDIVPKPIQSENKRFTYTYTNSAGLLKGLDEFYTVTKFVQSDKTFKKQKRNDYED